MQKYKNTILSFGFYIIALACYFFLLFIPDIRPSMVYGPTLILVLAGLFCGFRAINSKESDWVGRVAVVIGGVILILPLLIIMVGYGAL
jgi:uncharacterized membrane protein YqjE